MLAGSKLDIVGSFCNLGDVLCLGIGYELTAIIRTRAVWGTFINFFLFFYSHNLILTRCDTDKICEKRGFH